MAATTVEPVVAVMSSFICSERARTEPVPAASFGPRAAFLSW